MQTTNIRSLHRPFIRQFSHPLSRPIEMGGTRDACDVLLAQTGGAASIYRSYPAPFAKSSLNPEEKAMTTLQNMKTLFIAGLLVGAGSSLAMSHAGAPMTGGDAKKEMPTTFPAEKTGVMDMAEGEVRKVDAPGKKITIRHGEIKNLDMPPMTMVFQVREAALLEKFKAGDKVRFRAEKSGGAMVVTDVQPAR
jgi:Cu(I)/Ag(I) efflux system periplasmic protein CusF